MVQVTTVHPAQQIGLSQYVAGDGQPTPHLHWQPTVQHPVSSVRYSACATCLRVRLQAGSTAASMPAYNPPMLRPVAGANQSCGTTWLVRCCVPQNWPVADLAAAVRNIQSMRPFRVLATTLSFVLHRVNAICHGAMPWSAAHALTQACHVPCRTWVTGARSSHNIEHGLVHTCQVSCHDGARNRQLTQHK